MKKAIISFCSLLVFASSVFAFDFAVRLLPSYDITINDLLGNVIDGTVAADFHPINLRGRDSVYASLQGSYLFVKNDKIESTYVLDGALNAGYNFRLNDRNEIYAEGGIGYWFTPSQSREEYTIEAASGLSLNARAGENFYVTPGIQFGVFAGYQYFMYKPKQLMNNLQLGATVKLNLSNGLFSKSTVVEKASSTEAVYPVFFSRYNDHPFGSICFENCEKNNITDVVVTAYVEKYMSNPKVIGKYDSLGLGEEVELPLTAFFSDNILENLTSAKADLLVTITYKSIGQRKTVNYTLELQTLSRNSMNWDDDRHAAAFVSGKDNAAYEFSHRVVSIVKNDLNPNVPKNIQYATAIFGALRAFGINYVVDPSSAFTDNVGSSAIDFLQFPYQTLLYHGGDCDDLSILNCSLLESVGIDTAFITVPGHIYIAFDSGVSVDDAAAILKDGQYIIKDSVVWIPLEITLSQDPFTLAKKTGYKQWIKAGDAAALIPMKDAWKEFAPISVPDSNIDIEYPSNEHILKNFKEN